MKKVWRNPVQRLSSSSWSCLHDEVLALGPHLSYLTMASQARPSLTMGQLVQSRTLPNR